MLISVVTAILAMQQEASFDFHKENSQVKQVREIINPNDKQIRAIFPVQLPGNRVPLYGYYVYFNTNLSDIEDTNPQGTNTSFDCRQNGFKSDPSGYQQDLQISLFLLTCSIVRQRIYIQTNFDTPRLPKGFTVSYDGSSSQYLPGVKPFSFIVGTNDTYWSLQDVQQQSEFIRILNILRKENNLTELAVMPYNIAMLKAEDMAINKYFNFTHAPFGTIKDMVLTPSVNIKIDFRREAILQGAQFSNYQAAIKEWYFSESQYTLITSFQGNAGSYFSAKCGNDPYKVAFEMNINPKNMSYPGKMFPLRGNMIFKFKQESLEPDLKECVFYQQKPNFYRENFSEAYIYNTKFVLDSTNMIRAYGLPLGLYQIKCGSKTTTVRLQLQSYLRILEVDMNIPQNFDIEAPMQLDGIFNIKKGQLITFQKGIPLEQSEAVKNCFTFSNTSKNCTPPEIQTPARLLGRYRRLKAQIPTIDPLYGMYASQDMDKYNYNFVQEMIKTGGGEPSPEQPVDPYNGTFEPASGIGPTITPQGTGSIGGWTPPKQPSSSDSGSGPGSDFPGKGGGPSLSSVVNGIIATFVILGAGSVIAAIVCAILMALRNKVSAQPQQPAPEGGGEEQPKEAAVT